MPDFGVVSAVSQTLEQTLTGALSALQPPPPPIARVHDLAGAIPTAPALLTVFLYEVIEDPSARNRHAVREPGPTSVMKRKTPMALLLKYLLTPWGGDRLTEHRMIGRVLQTLYDGAILSGSQLQGNLAGTNEALKVTLAPLTLEERSRVWWAIQKPYRLSLNYEIRVVNLDAEIRQEVPYARSRTLQGEVSLGQRAGVLEGQPA